MESLAVPLVNSILGSYISNLETNQLSIGLWDGNVKLQNLKLKRDLFLMSKIPLAIVWSRIEEMTITIPWADLKNKPLKISVRGASVLVAPVSRTDYDPETENVQLQEEKQQKLKRAELALKQSEENQDGYFAQVLTALVDNVQITINNIHVRYEDDSIGSNYGAGFTLEELSAVSTDQNWSTDHFGVNSGIIYKLMKLCHFGAYCNTENSSWFGREDKELIELFGKEIQTTSLVDPAKQFLMNPVTGIGKLVWVKAFDVNKPKYDLSVEFDDLAFNLDDHQYSTILSIVNILGLKSRSWPYRKFRPPAAITPKLDPKIWFQYAIKCVSDDIHRQFYSWSWKYFKSRRDDRILYIDLYTRLRKGIIEQTQLEDLKQLELKLSYDDIRLYRHLALSKFKYDEKPKQVDDKSETSAGQKSWLGWIASSLTETQEPDEDDWNVQLKKIYEKIDFDEVMTEGVYPPDSCRLKIACHLASGSFSLRRFTNGMVKDFVTSRFDNLRLLQFGYIKSSQTQIRMENFIVVSPDVNTNFGTLIEAKKMGGAGPRSEDFFTLNYEYLPLDNRADTALDIKILPLKILMNPDVFNKITTFFKPIHQESESISRLQKAAQGAFAGSSLQSKAGLLFAIEEHKSLDLNIEANSPIFIFPSASGRDIASGLFLLIDSGHCKVTSDYITQETKKKIQEMASKTVTELVQDIYDKFTINLSSAKIMLAQVDDSIQDRLEFINPDLILEDFDFSIRVDVCILPAATEYTKYKVFADLPRFHLNISQRKLLTIKKISEIMSSTFSAESENTAAEMWGNTKSITPVDDVLDALRDEEIHQIDQIPSNQTFFDIHLLFHRCSLELFEDDGRDKEFSIAQFEANDIEIKFSSKHEDGHLIASLGSLIIRDTSIHAIPEFSLLISPDKNMNEAMVTVDLRMKKAQQGEFRDLVLTVNPIKFVLARECVLRIHHILSNLVTPANAGGRRNSVDSFSSAQSRDPSSVSRSVAAKSITNRAHLKIRAITLVLAETDKVLGLCIFEGLDLTANSVGACLKMNGEVGKLSLFQENMVRRVLYIEEDRALDFKFEAFDPEVAVSIGFDSAMSVNAASWRLIYDKYYVGSLSAYFGKMQEMRAVLEGARKAALETQQQVAAAVGKFFIEFNMKTPIIEVPNGGKNSADALIFYPGSVKVENASLGPGDDNVISRFQISIRNVKLQSAFYREDGISCGDMLKDLNIDILWDNLTASDSIPNSFYKFNLSDVNLAITNHQYRLFAEIISLITAPDPNAMQMGSDTNLAVQSQMEILVNIPQVSLEGFSCPSKFSDPAQHSLARLLGSSATAKLQTRANGLLEFELSFSGLSVLDTRISKSSFRDIMTPLKSSTGANQHQFELRYCSTPNSMEYNLTIDRPKLILEVDHILAVRAFALSAWNTGAPPPNPQINPLKSFKGRVKFYDAEIIVIAEPEKPNTDAVILLSKNWVVTQESVLTVCFQDVGMYFCVMNQRDATKIRFLDDCNISVTMDDRLRPEGHYVYHIDVELSKLLFRVSYQDVLLISELLSRIKQGLAAPIQNVPPPALTNRPNLSEQFRLSLESVQALLIDDLSDLHMPLFEFGLDKTLFEMSNWSTALELNLGLSLFANYFNVKNSHWEPMIESSHFSINGQNESQGKRAITVFCRKKLELNVTHTLVETVLVLMEKLNTSINSRRGMRLESKSPYVVKNLTGYPIVIWTDASPTEPELTTLADGKSTNWRFEDWKKIRERVNPVPNKFAVQFQGPSWETVKGISVDQEGSVTYSLRPAIQNVLHKLVVDVKLEDKVKVVTFRSGKVIKNSTNIEIEIAMTRSTSERKPKAQRILPGESYPIPIESAYHDSIYVRPADLGYKWSMQGIHWRDLIGKKRIREYLVNCPSYDDNMPFFNFQMTCEFHNYDSDYPELTMSFMPPFILENLLPLEFKYVIQDKVSRQQYAASLAKGAKEYLHTLNPSHLLAFSLAIKEKGLVQKESVIITSTDLEYRDEVLTLQDGSGNELTLRIIYTDSKKNGRVVSVMSPYLIINRTGMDLFFSAKSLLTSNRATAGQSQQDHKSGKIEPIMFSYSTLEPVRSRALVKALDSDWSKPVSFEAVGSAFMLNLSAIGGRDILLGFDVAEGLGKYHLSKIVTVSPRFILRNNLNQDISYGQAGVLTPYILKAGQILPVMKLLTSQDHDDYHMCVRFTSTLSAWSNPFSLTQIGNIYLKIGRIGSLTEDLIRIDVSIEKATIFISFSKEDGKWPFKIENHTNVDVTYYQQGSSKTYSIVPGEEQVYAWDYPSFEDKKFTIDVNGRARLLEFTELGALVPFKYPIANGRAVMALELVAQGPTIILKLNAYDPRQSSFVADKTTDAFEEKEEESEIISKIRVRIEGVGISFVSRNMNEILYASAKQIIVAISETKNEVLNNLQVQWFQVDNQLSTATSPIVLYPTVLHQNKKDKDPDNPVFFGSFCRSKDKTLGVDYYQWLTVLLQELSIDLDEDLLRAMIDFSHFSTSKSIEVEDPCDLDRAMTFPKFLDGSDRLYFDRFLLQPVQINMSFNRTVKKEVRKGDAQTHTGGHLHIAYDVLTMTIGNIHDAPIRLNALELQHPIFSVEQLKDLIMKFYMREIYGQVHRIVGSADFLGNPVGLFNNVASGVKDMFYEPIMGFEITKPEEFGFGVAKGAGSLVKKTVFGLSDTFAKFSGSIGKGLAVMTMDSKYQESRRLASRNRPKHVGQGMAKGAKGLVQGFASGLTGIVSQPYQGAQEAGIEGFFKGFGRGLLGAVTKPLVGVADLAAGVTEGIKNTANNLEDDLDRQRLPRHIGKDGILKPYNLREALGQSWLREVSSGKYLSEVYLCHLEMRIDDLCAIVTETRVLMIHIKRVKLEYDAKFSEVRKIEARSETDIALVVKGNSENEWIIPCPSKQTNQWLRKIIEAAFSEFIRQRKEFD